MKRLHRAVIDRAKLYISLGMFDNAKKALTAALAENEFDPVAHFLMGRLWLEDKDWMQARKELRIAFNIQPMGFSAAGRLGIAVANEFYKSGDRALRIEALQYSDVYLQRPQVDGADPFENSATLTILDSNVRAVKELLLGLSGKWFTGAGYEYTFQEVGTSDVYKIFTRDSSGYLRRTAPMTFEGGVSSSGCAWDLALQESDDGETLSGTIRVSQPPHRACRQMAFTKEALKGKPGPFNLQR